MEERVMYCRKCEKIYHDYFNMYGENCNICGSILVKAVNVQEREYSCLKLVDY